MSIEGAWPIASPPADRWRLWVDGSGGFLLLTGNRIGVGGWSSQAPADVCVRADWPRLAGVIERVGADYFWTAQSPPPACRQLISHGGKLPIAGSATMTLDQPSPLCDSAVLRLASPHRFDQHVDGVILMNGTLLIGPSADCHIRCRDAQTAAVLVRRQDRWLAKLGLTGEFEELYPGRRMNMDSLTMTLEPV